MGSRLIPWIRLRSKAGNIKYHHPKIQRSRRRIMVSSSLALASSYLALMLSQQTTMSMYPASSVFIIPSKGLLSMYKVRQDDTRPTIVTPALRNLTTDGLQSDQVAAKDPLRVDHALRVKGRSEVRASASAPLDFKHTQVSGRHFDLEKWATHLILTARSSKTAAMTSKSLNWNELSIRTVAGLPK